MTPPTTTPRFRLLGPPAAVLDGRRVPLGPDHEQRLFVALLAARCLPVSRRSLIGWVWDTPGPTAAEMLDELVTSARGRLTLLGLPGTLICEKNLCRLEVDTDSVDLHRFRGLVDAARVADDRRAAGLLAEAVAMFDGEPLGTLCGERITNFRTTLLDELMSARLEHVERSLRLGRQEEILPGLVQLSRTEPFHQGIAALLMRAHHQNDDPARALEAFERIRTQLVDNLGVDVGDELVALRRRILERNGEDVVPAEEPKPVTETSYTTGDKAAMGIRAIAAEHLVVDHTGRGLPAIQTPTADHVATGKKTAASDAVAVETMHVAKAGK
jgi:DNA-binding SARP family transcriptional activator